MEIYFDDFFIYPSNLMAIHWDAQLFNGRFRIGATLCQTMSITISRASFQSASALRPSYVYIKENGETLATMLIDTIDDSDDSSYVFNLVDKMVLLNTVYDWSGLSSPTVQSVVNAICTDVLDCTAPSVEYMGNAPVSFVNVMARDFISYVAEVNASFAEMDENGNLRFVRHKETKKRSVNVSSCEKFKVGSYHIIDKVIYGEDENTTESSSDTVTIKSNNGHIYLDTTEDRYYTFQKIEFDNVVNTSISTTIPDPIDFPYGDFVLFCDSNIGHHEIPFEVTLYGGRVSIEMQNNGTRQKVSAFNRLNIIDITSSAEYMLDDANNGFKAYPSAFQARVQYSSYDVTIKVGSEARKDKLSTYNTSSIGPVYTDVNDVGDVVAIALDRDGFVHFVNFKTAFGLNTVADFITWLGSNPIKARLVTEEEIQITETYSRDLSIFNTLNTGKYDFYTGGYGSDYIQNAVNGKNVSMTLGLVSTAERNFLYLNNENILFNNSLYTTQEIVDHIFGEIGGLQFYSMDVSRCRIPQDIKAGDFVLFKNDVGITEYISEYEYPTIAQINFDYNTEWLGGFTTQVDNLFQEETAIVSQSEQVKSDIAQIQIGLANVQSDVSELQSDMNTVQSDLGTVQTDLETVQTTLSDKMGLVNSPNTNDILLTDANGQAIDSGKLLSEFQQLLTAGTGIQLDGATISNVFATLSGPDLDDITYNYQGYVTQCTNAPSGANYNGELIAVGRQTGTQYFIQLYSPYNSNALYIRSFNSTWTAWTQIYSASSLTGGDGINISSGGVINNRFANLTGVDLDTVKYNCLVWCNDACTNLPKNYGGLLLSCFSSNNSSYGVQIFTSYAISGKGTFYRRHNGGTWADWVQFPEISTGTQTVQGTYCTVVANWAQEGNICSVYGTVTPSTAISSSTGNVTISNLPKPSTYVFFTAGTSVNAWATVNGRLTSSSVFRFNGTMTSGTAYYFNFTYAC